VQQSASLMHRTHLSLANFRNFVCLEKDFPAGPTLLVGANAQAKTSLLEAIFYLIGASSPHSTSDRQVINFLALKETLPFAALSPKYGVLFIDRAKEVWQAEES
jgi:recombinational DNA repair ATPase RecF